MRSCDAPALLAKLESVQPAGGLSHLRVPPRENGARSRGDEKTLPKRRGTVGEEKRKRFRREENTFQYTCRGQPSDKRLRTHPRVLPWKRVAVRLCFAFACAVTNLTSIWRGALRH